MQGEPAAHVQDSLDYAHFITQVGDANRSSAITREARDGVLIVDDT
jgi:hypothetical protein